MGTLFNIVGEFQQLYEMATEEDTDQQTFLDTLESLMGELETKSASYVAVVNQLQMGADVAKEISDRYAAKAKARMESIKRMKDRLKVAMVEMGKDEIPAGDFTIKLRNNGGKQPLVLDGSVPEKFHRIIYEPDKELIRTYLNGEKDQRCEWAHLEPRGQHVDIK